MGVEQIDINKPTKPEACHSHVRRRVVNGSKKL
jgi:hypothetical protein